MRKPKPVTLPKISADKIAANLKKGCGEVRAIKIAHTLSKNLNALTIADLTEFGTARDLKKQQNTWTQVFSILQKQAK